MDRGSWWATLHRVTQNQTQLNRLNMHTLGQIGLAFASSDNKRGSPPILVEQTGNPFSLQL